MENVPQKFSLENGTISFNEHGITINDKAKGDKAFMIIQTSIGALFGGLILLRYQANGDEVLFKSGLLFLFVNLFLLIAFLFRSSKQHIPYSQISSIKCKHRFDRYFLDIRLKNKRLRRVIGVEELPKIEAFINVNLPGFASE